MTGLYTPDLERSFQGSHDFVPLFQFIGAGFTAFSLQLLGPLSAPSGQIQIKITIWQLWATYGLQHINLLYMDILHVCEDKEEIINKAQSILTFCSLNVRVLVGFVIQHPATTDRNERQVVLKADIPFHIDIDCESIELH